MAGRLDIPKGTKLKIAQDSMSRESLPGFTLISTFYTSIDDATFLISVPMKEGKSLDFDETQKFLICYVQGEQDMIVSAYPDMIIKEGIHRYWKMRRVSEFRRFFQRADERIKIALSVDYTSDKWALNADGTQEYRDGLTLDISAGGAAVFMNQQFKVGDFCELTLPRVGTTPEGRSIENIVSMICWMREAPKGCMYKNICGMQFRFSDPSDREHVKEYVAAVKTKYKL